MGVECYRCGEAMTPQGGCGCQDGICLVCGDCLEVLPLLEPGSVDVLFTDPPYGIVNEFGIHENAPGKGSRRLQFAWDGQVIVDTVRRGLTLGFSFCKKSASCFVYCGFDTAERYAEPAWRAGFTVKPASWVKHCPPPAGNGNWWPSGFELAYYGYRNGAYFGDENPKRSNVWVADSYRYGQPGKLNHPTQKPLTLIRQQVESLTQPNFVVLDPFAGSGTTGRACKDLGRRCLMVEIEEKYVKIAANRLRQEVLF